MIKVKFEYEGNKSEFNMNISDITTYHKNVIELVEDLGHLENEVLSKAASIADPTKELGPHIYNCERGGERQQTSDEIEARKFGFTQLSYEINDKTTFILSE